MTEFHRSNMKKHIAFLENNANIIRHDFKMDELQDNPGCGSPSCSLGWATVSTGIKFTSCVGYSNDVFGIKIKDDKWSYLFHSLWINVNNTPEAAAARMKAVLYNQVPAEWNYSEEFSHPIVIIPEEIQVKELELVQ